MCVFLVVELLNLAHFSTNTHLTVGIWPNQIRNVNKKRNSDTNNWRNAFYGPMMHHLACINSTHRCTFLNQTQPNHFSLNSWYETTYQSNILYSKPSSWSHACPTGVWRILTVILFNSTTLTQLKCFSFANERTKLLNNIWDGTTSRALPSISPYLLK